VSLLSERESTERCKGDYSVNLHGAISAILQRLILSQIVDSSIWSLMVHWMGGPGMVWAGALSDEFHFTTTFIADTSSNLNRDTSRGPSCAPATTGIIDYIT